MTNLSKNPPPPASASDRGSFGDLRAEGFRITRWDDDARVAGRHWFDAHSLVLCLNVSGKGRFHAGGSMAKTVEPGSYVIATAPGARPFLERSLDGRHRFVVLEMRRPWTKRWLPATSRALHPTARRFVESARSGEASCETQAMGAPLAQIAADLIQPPGMPAAMVCWHHAKALEMVAHALFVSAETELFCERTRRVGRERVERVREILLAELENPPALSDLGRRVGCSPFYLSRIFRQETGATISSFLRGARMERAAELLRTGEANVTEAATTVGYSSLSHFSKAFAQSFGCCPCLYGRKPREAATARGAA